MKADHIMKSMGAALDEALSEGTTFEEFQKKIKPALQKKGWWEEKHAQRWLQDMFDTGLRSAYAAEKWGQIQRTKKTAPYLRYLAFGTRAECRLLHGVVRLADDPFWDKFYPYGCGCSVQQLSERDLKQLGLSMTKDEDLPRG